MNQCVDHGDVIDLAQTVWILIISILVFLIYRKR